MIKYTITPHSMPNNNHVCILHKQSMLKNAASGKFKKKEAEERWSGRLPLLTGYILKQVEILHKNA